MGDIDISFAEYSMSKSVHLTPDTVEYDPGAIEPLYDLIIGKQSLHDIGAVLDFKDKTITIDSICWRKALVLKRDPHSSVDLR